MTTNKKILLIGLAAITASITVYIFSQDARRKRINNTVVPPNYALTKIKEISAQ